MWFSYQYFIWLSCRTENILCGDVPYFLWHGTRPSYKHIKVWGLRVYIINKHVTIKKLDYRSHRGCFMGYEANTVVILYWKLYQTFFLPQIPPCLIWWIWLLSLHIRQAHSWLFTTSKISWNFHSWFRPPQLDFLWTWS